MPVVLFKGRVVPEVRNVTAPGPTTIRYSEPTGFEGIFCIDIQDPEVRVECELNDLTEDSLGNATIRALGFASGVANVIAFTTGWSLHVVLDTSTVGGTERPLALSEKRVAPLCTAYGLEDRFEEVCELVLTDMTLRFAFSDLIAGIGSENYSLVACGRAMDAIRLLVAGYNVDPKKGWRAMREALRVDESYLRAITEASTQPRHGARGVVSGSTQLEMTLRAWAIMNRYLEYRMRGGDTPLPAGEFPVLVS